MAKSKSARLRSRREREVAFQRELRREALRRMTAAERAAALNEKRQRARALRRGKWNSQIQMPEELEDTKSLHQGETASEAFVAVGASGGGFAVFFCLILSAIGSSLQHPAAQVFYKSSGGLLWLTVPLAAFALLGVILKIAQDLTEISPERSQSLIAGYAMGLGGYFTQAVIEGTLKSTDLVVQGSFTLGLAEFIGGLLGVVGLTGVLLLAYDFFVEFGAAIHRAVHRLVPEE